MRTTFWQIWSFKCKRGSAEPLGARAGFAEDILVMQTLWKHHILKDDTSTLAPQVRNAPHTDEEQEEQEEHEEQEEQEEQACLLCPLAAHRSSSSP
jgi:hypothetical protein